MRGRLNKMKNQTFAANYSFRLNARFAFVAALLLGLAASPKTKAGLIVNPGFETGSFSGWATTGPYLRVEGGGHSGSFDAYCGAGTSDNGTIGDLLSQTFTTVPGQNYNISIWVNGSSSGQFGEIYIQWDNSKVLDLSDPDFSGWTELQVTATATSSSSSVGFGSRNQPAAYSFDDANVSVVPEPSAMIWVGLLFAGLLLRAVASKGKKVFFAADRRNPRQA